MNLDYTTLHFNSVISHFSDQFRNEEFLDCTLNAEGKSIKVHRAVLCAQSSLLEKMILEHVHVNDLFVTLDGVPFEDLKSVVQFMYDGWTRLSKANFGSFLVVAQLLGMKWVDYVQINVEEVDAAANEASEPLQDITNVDLPPRKRKKCMKTKRHSKKLKCTRAERRLALRSPQDVVEETSHETDLAKMDESTFCTALGLKKITDEDVLPKLKLVSRTKRMPSLIKINCEEDKENEQPEHSVYIEEKNLSFLNANVNEMRIRENNIEIECDVLEASSQYVVYEKGNAEEIVELHEGNSDAANNFHSGRSTTGSVKRSSPRPSKSTHRMFVPGPRRKPPLIDLSRSSPTCSNIEIRVSDVATNSEKSKFDEDFIGDIIDLDEEEEEEEDDYFITIDEDGIEIMSDTTDAMDESIESDDDVVVTGESVLEDRASFCRKGKTSIICNESTSVILHDNSSVVHNDGTSTIPNGDVSLSPTLLSTSLREMMSPESRCECRPLKTYPGKIPARTGPSVGLSTPLAPGGRSSLSPAARAHLFHSHQTAIRIQPAPINGLSPLTSPTLQTAPSSNAVSSPTKSFAVCDPVPQLCNSVLQSTENLRVPQSVYQVPNKEIDEEMVKKYHLKNLSINLSKTKCLDAIKMQEKANFLNYFKIVERSTLKKSYHAGRVKPLVIGLNKRFPYVVNKRMTKKRPSQRPLPKEGKSFQVSAKTMESSSQVVKNVVVS